MPFDTSAQAAAVQEEILRRMTPSERAEMALAMSNSLREVALAGLRGRRPELNNEELIRELIRLLYGTPATP